MLTGGDVESAEVPRSIQVSFTTLVQIRSNCIKKRKKAKSWFLLGRWYLSGLNVFRWKRWQPSCFGPVDLRTVMYAIRLMLFQDKQLYSSLTDSDWTIAHVWAHAEGLYGTERCVTTIRMFIGYFGTVVTVICHCYHYQPSGRLSTPAGAKRASRVWSRRMIIKAADAIARGGVEVKRSAGQDAVEVRHRRHQRRVGPRSMDLADYPYRSRGCLESFFFLSHSLICHSTIKPVFAFRPSSELHVLKGRRKKVELTTTWTKTKIVFLLNKTLVEFSWFI